MVWALLLGCAKTPPASSGDLVDQGAKVPSQTSVEIVEKQAADLDPDRRAQALGWWVRATPTEQLNAVITRGLHDPAHTVQTAVALATLERDPTSKLLHEAASRALTDPYLRAQLAHTLSIPTTTMWKDYSEPWFQAPLLIQSTVGDEREQGLRVLRNGDVRSDAGWFIHLVPLEIEGLDDALIGALSSEPELALLAAFTLHARGSSKGTTVVRKALQSSDPTEVIEAIEWKDRDRFVVGVQWHPERMKEKEQRQLFKEFVRAASK